MAEEGVEEPVVAAAEEEAAFPAAAEEEEEFVASGSATEIKLFGKWSFDDIEIRDISLVVRKIMHPFIVADKRAILLLLHSLVVVLSLTHTRHSGLYCLQGCSRDVFAAHGGSLPKEAFSQGVVSDCRALGLLSHEEGPEQWQEAHGGADCQTHAGNHPPLDGPKSRSSCRGRHYQ